MVKLNAIDLCSIQECLDAYKKIINWLPVTSECEINLKDARVETINYLIKKCESIIREEAKKNG